MRRFRNRREHAPRPLPNSTSTNTPSSTSDSTSSTSVPSVQSSKSTLSKPVLLGHQVNTDEEILSGDIERTLRTYIIGSTGMGKSTLMLNMILQDIESGKSVVLLDPDGDLVRDVLARTNCAPERIVLLDPLDWRHPFGLNLFECSAADDPLARELAADNLLSIFKKLWGTGGILPSWGQQLEDLLTHITKTFVQAQGYSLTDVPRFLEDSAFRSKVIQNVSFELQQYWTLSYDPRQDNIQYRQSTLTRIRKFTDHEVLSKILGQNKSTVNFGEIIESGKVLLLPIPTKMLGEECSSLLGMIIIHQLLIATFSRSDKPASNRRPFSIYADEFHSFMSNDFALFFTQGRKYGVQIVVAHQIRNQLDTNTRSAAMNLGNKIIFRIQSQDAQVLASEFKDESDDSHLPFVHRPATVLLKKTHAHPTINKCIQLGLVPFMSIAQDYDKINKKHKSAEFLNYFDDYYLRLIRSVEDPTSSIAHEEEISILVKAATQVSPSRGLP